MKWVLPLIFERAFKCAHHYGHIEATQWLQLLHDEHKIIGDQLLEYFIFIAYKNKIIIK
jgi:hypothetical protein